MYFQFFFATDTLDGLYDLVCGASIYLHTRALEKHFRLEGLGGLVGLVLPSPLSVVWLPEKVMTRCHDLACGILVGTLGPGHCFSPENGVWERMGFRYVDHCR